MSALQIPGYSIERELGRGGMARVYLAVQRKFGRLVAVKVVSPEYATLADFGARFVREARIVAQLHHPNIVQVYDAGVSGDSYYLVQEYLRGGDLNQRLERGMHMQAAVGVIKDIARALDHAHAKGYIHCDIKPENILFREDGSALLSDFGVAALYGDSSANAAGNVLGTPEFMSPEQAAGRALDGRSDLYSLGIVFYRILTGEVPYRATAPEDVALKHLQQPIPRLPAHLADFQPVIDTLLAKRPEQRCQRGAEIVTLLETLRVDGRVPNTVIKTQAVTTAEVRAVSDIHVVHDPRALRADPRPERAHQHGRARPRSWVAVGLVVALCGAAWFGWHQRDAIEGVIYSSGLVQSPEVKTAWRAAQALRRDPTQGLVAIVDAYQRVLAINPNHERTHGVLHMLAETWHADIVAALSADDLTLAETRLNEALTAFPTDDSFGALFDDLGNLKRAESLVTSTEALLRSRGLDDQPSATTAIQAYHEVLRLHPGNARARSGLDRLARHYGTLANGAADDGDVTFAMSYLQIAAAANAQYATLASAREKIQRATTLQQEILTLLQQAEQQVSRGALVDPPGSNAAELFRRVLATDPDNATASSGLERVASEVQARADRLFAAGRIDELRRLVERSGEVGLNASLVQQLQRSLNTEQRRLAEVDRLLREAGEMLANGYITAPADGNAVERLVRLLRIDPDHREARRMLRAAAERLADVAQEAHAVGMSAEARQYMELALGVVPDQAEWRRLLQDWSGTRRAARLADGDHTVPLGATDP